MAKTFLIINRTLVGPASENIQVNWKLEDNERRGHPLVHSRGSVDLDYFRRSMARYYTWNYGTRPANYKDFGYLLPAPGAWKLSDQTTAAPWQLLIGFNVAQDDPPLAGSNVSTILDYAWYSQTLAVLQTTPNTYIEIENLMAMPDVDPNPFGPRPNMGYEFLDSMLITADQNKWESISDQYSVIPSMETLIYEPTADYGNWQAYVLGAAVAPASPPRQWPGILGYGMTDKTFFDHVTQRNCPSNLAVSSDFNSFNTFFSNLATNPYVQEVYMPNLYMVASVLQNGTDPFPIYETLYSAYDSSGDSIYVDSSVSNVKEVLSLVTAPPSGDVPALQQADILDGTSHFSVLHLPASSQAPNTLLSRFTRKDFTDPASAPGLVRAANINRHLGLPYNLVKGDIPAEMNGLSARWPYSISVEYADPNAQSQFIKSIWLQDPNDASLVDQTEAMADFFLYEVMKANILNFENASDGGSTGTGVAKEDQIYESIPVSAVQAETGEQNKYYGFDWMSAPGGWASSTQDLEPYNVRAIDIGNLFKNIFKYQLDSNIPEGSYDNSNSATEQSCNGFMGQSPTENIVDQFGLIIGKVFNSTAYTGVKNTEVMTDGLAQIGMDFEDLMGLFIHTADYYSQNMRTYQQMLDGSLAHRDTILFKLDKHTVDPVDNKPSQDPIQSIYIANVGGATEYIDTQVFSSKKYMYKLYAYDLVIGNEYKYINPEVFPPPPSRYPNPLAYLISKFEDHNLQELDAPMILPWSASGPGGKLRITGVGSSFENNSYVAGANIDVNYPLFVDMSLGPSSQAYRPALALSPDARISLSDTINRIGYENWEELASSLEAVMNFMVSMYYNHPDAPPEYILNNNSTGRYLNEVRVRAVKKDGAVYLFVGTVAALLAGGRNSAQRMAFAESWPIDPDGYGASNPFPLGLIAQGLSGTNPGEDQTLDPYESYFNLWMSSTDPMVQATEGFDTPAYTAAEAQARGAIAPFPMSWDLLTGQHGEDPDLSWDTARIGEAEVSIYNYKSPKLLEIPIAESQIIEVLDLPPQYPDVEIFPLKGSNKEIKILLNSNFTKGVYSPIVIEPGDEEVFNAQRIAQGRPLPVDGGEAPILFGSDDYGNTTYQVFRVTDPPVSYQDFADNRTHTLLGTTAEGAPVESVSLRDFVDPNVTYYYCFRTIDKNGYPSNPTPILKVQVVDDNGRIYPLIEPYDFNLDDPRDTERSFKRYLEIDTSIQERMVSALPMNQTASAGSPYAAPSVSIGNTIWDGSTEFKIRITSKDTGRKIDLNLNFTVETIPNPNLPGN